MKKFFEGRIKRLNYFGASLLLGLIYLVATFLLAMISKNNVVLISVSRTLIVVMAIASLFFQVSLTVRRLHDINMSGYLAIVCFLPTILRFFKVDPTMLNGIIVIILLLIKGTNGVNKYGNVDQNKNVLKVIFP